MTLKILGYHFTIENTNDSDTMGSYGRTNFDKQIIQVASEIKDEQKISTIIHEIIEVLNYHMEFNLDHNVIMSLEAGLFQSLTDNGVDLLPLIKNER